MSKTAWQRLGDRELAILAHLTGMFSGLAQTLVIEPEKPVRVWTVDHYKRDILVELEDAPVPTQEEFERIRTACLEHPERGAVLSETSSQIVVRGFDS